EDGIRDFHVTGVQTCALPILLGYGPLEPLLARDDIADIMINGSQRCYIEVNGRVKLTNVRFRDDAHLMNVCQRIVSQVGRRVDEIGRASCRERAENRGRAVWW